MKIQVLAIGEIASGKSQNGREWHRRTFQVFVPESQLAGNIPVYGVLSELDSYKQGGYYDASMSCRAGQNGRLELAFTKLIPIKPQPV